MNGIDLDELIARFLSEESQKKHRQMLEDHLKAGASISYRDDKGNLVRENPDGTIEILDPGPTDDGER